MIIFCGLDTDKAKTEFLSYRERLMTSGEQVQWFVGREITLPRLLELLSGSDLFGNSGYVFLEGWLATFRDKKKAMDFLDTVDSSKLVLMEEKMDRRWFGKRIIDVREYKPSNEIFAFLDNLGQDNKRSYLLLSDLLKIEPPEKIYRMVMYRLVDLIGGGKGKAPWMAGRIQKQARSMPFERWQAWFCHWYEWDRKLRKGVLGNDLSVLMEMWFLDVRLP